MHFLNKHLVVQWITFKINTRQVMRSNLAHHLHIIFDSKIFYDVIKFLDFLRQLERCQFLIRVTISNLNMAWRKKFTEIFISRRGRRFVHPCLDVVDIFGRERIRWYFWDSEDLSGHVTDSFNNEGLCQNQKRNENLHLLLH